MTFLPGSTTHAVYFHFQTMDQYIWTDCEINDIGGQFHDILELKSIRFYQSPQQTLKYKSKN